VDTWGSLHAGDVVLGGDPPVEWGVERVVFGEVGQGLQVTLVRHGERATAMIKAHLPVVVVRRADTSEEYRAAETLLAAGLTPEVIEERWES
jgi:hypothetical protein